MLGKSDERNPLYFNDGLNIQKLQGQQIKMPNANHHIEHFLYRSCFPSQISSNQYQVTNIK